MTQARIFEGTPDEIAEQLLGGKLTGRFRAILVPENGTDLIRDDDTGESLLERLNGRVGVFDFGGVNLSEDTDRKYTDLLLKKKNKGHD